MGAAKKLTREEREKILKLKHRYENRITLARFGKDSFNAGDYGNALRKYIDYINIHMEVNKVQSIYALRTSHFHPKRDLTEMLMLSHIYFELARLYDVIPKLQDDCQKCLEQFVHFSANQPYQVVNSEMVRKYLKKSAFRNPQFFSFAYQQIYVQSKKCYVVTFCYGTDHPVTQDCREFKDWLLEYSWGQRAVATYYRYSSVAVERWAGHPLAKASALFLRPLLLLFSKTLLKLILK